MEDIHFFRGKNHMEKNFLKAEQDRENKRGKNFIEKEYYRRPWLILYAWSGLICGSKKRFPRVSRWDYEADHKIKKQNMMVEIQIKRKLLYSKSFCW